MAQIKLTEQHQSLVTAAIRLGDWIASLPEATKSDISAIKAIQLRLVDLPNIEAGTLAMYGFSIERGDASQGLIRGWDVSLEYASSEAVNEGGLEIFSSYLPIPETEDKASLSLKKEAEVYFHWAVDERCNYIDVEQQNQWINEVSQPTLLFQQGDRLRVELVYQDYYSEIDCQLSSFDD